MKVSVSMVAYNHEKLVGLAIESVLAQKTNFPFELVIGEDYSTDGTRAVIEGFRAKHPGIIRVLDRGKNLGMERNHRDTVSQCVGEYVAVLDSDDYWVSEDKLQKQVEMMDANPDMVIACHRARVVDGDNKPTGDSIPREAKPISTVEDLIRSNFVVSCTVMYRRSALPAFPDWYDTITTYDWPLHILTAAAGGTVGYTEREDAAYRIHGAGAYSQLKEFDRLNREINCYRRLLETLPERLHPATRQGLSLRLLDLSNNRRRASDLAAAREAFQEAMRLQSWDRKIPWRKAARQWARLYIPIVSTISTREREDEPR